MQEDTASKNGYLNTALTAEMVRSAVEELNGKKRPQAASETIIFSREVRRTFEAATNECKRSGVTYISPEHIALALLSTPSSESVAIQVIQKHGVDVDVLRFEVST